MKLYSNKSIAFALLAALLLSCNNDDKTGTITGEGNLEIEFDNAFGSNDLILHSQLNTTSNGEALKIGDVKYIISNIELTDGNGSIFVYPKTESYFVVSEADEDSHVIELENIPAGNYTGIRFGIGVDEPYFNLGQANQGAILESSQAVGMIDDWNEGYDFFKMDGNFTSSSIIDQTPFSIVAKKTATNYNYKEITLNLPSKALVRTTITPEIHIVADISKLIDGVHKLKLSDHISAGTAVFSDKDDLAAIADNILSIFTVAHVHND